MTSISALLSEDHNMEIFRWAALQHKFGVNTRKLKLIKSSLANKKIECLDDLLEGLDQTPRISQEIKIFLENLKIDEKTEQEIWKLIDKDQVVPIIDQRYPKSLWSIPDPPLAITINGKLPDLKRAVAVVGRRNATSFGNQLSNDIGKLLATKSITVVSGLAHGIDIMAHIGCLAMKGKAVAVLGTPINHIYPKVHENIFYDVVKQGAAISDVFIKNSLLQRSFSDRNRIISGISKAVVVVETNEKGGTIKQMMFAKNQGKTIFMHTPKNNVDAKKMAEKFNVLEFKNIEDLEQRLDTLFKN